MAYLVKDPFVDRSGQARSLRGVIIQSNSARLAEMAGIIGFDTVWIDVEHGPVSFTEVESLCMAAEAGGCVSTVRIPSNARHHVLRAVDAGAQILVVPMIDNARDAEKIVEHGKFPPLGQRGFNMSTRGMQYGLDYSKSGDPDSALKESNDRTHFFAQIESQEAVDNLDAICNVDGLAGILVGPGDLSASRGQPGAFSDPELQSAVASIIERARSLGKHAGIVAMPGPLLDKAIAAGCDLAFCATDLVSLTESWTNLLETVLLNSK